MEISSGRVGRQAACTGSRRRRLSDAETTVVRRTDAVEEEGERVIPFARAIRVPGEAAALPRSKSVGRPARCRTRLGKRPRNSESASPCPRVSETDFSAEAPLVRNTVRGALVERPTHGSFIRADASPRDDALPSPPASLHLGRAGIPEGGTATDRCALNHPPDQPSKRAASSLARSKRAALRGSSVGKANASANTRCRSK